MNRENDDRKLFDIIAEHYAQKDIVKSSIHARKYKLMQALMPVLKETSHIGTIVDVACGIGAPALYLKGKYDNYIGVDHSEKLIGAAKIFHKDNLHARFIACNVKQISENILPPHSVDVILAIGALHHMTEFDKIFQSLAIIAKPGAYFIALEPNNSNPIIQGMRRIRWVLDNTYSEEQRFFSKSELQQILSPYLENVVLEYKGFLSPPFAEVALPFQKLSVPLSEAAVWADKKLDIYLPNFLKFLSWNISVYANFPK